MTKHVKAFTYAPKIPAVRRGDCRQTIRPKHTVKPGDWVTWHGWSGKPYRTPWSWRLEDTLVKEVDYVYAYIEGMTFVHKGHTITHVWESLDIIAQADGIDPPTGMALGLLMDSHYNLEPWDLHNPTKGKPMQIIQWMRTNHQSDFWGPGGSYAIR